jgi:hypothetical protein
MVATFANGSDQAVTLKGIEPVPGEGFGDVGEVVRIEIAPRNPPFAELSIYGTCPPVEPASKNCIVQETFPVDGYVLEPGERVALVVWWRALKQGRFRIDSERVIYERDGKTYEQRLPFGIVGLVNGNRDHSLGQDHARCAHLVEVVPGWRLPDPSNQ